MEESSSQQHAWQLLQQIMQAHVLNQQPLTTIDFSKVDHAYFKELLKEHRLELIAFNFLKNILPDTHPFMMQLQNKYLKSVFRHLQQKKVLLQISKQFEINGMAYVTLKGPALNNLLYQDHCLRQSCDLDILISPEHTLNAHYALLNIGFQLAEPQYLSSITQDALLFSQLKKDVSYINNDKTIVLELHYRSNISKKVGLHFYENYPVEKNLIMNQQVNILSAEDNLLYLCLHGAKHHWTRLQWLIDLAKFTQSIPLDWDKVIQLAQDTYCLRPLLELKQLLTDFFALELPAIPASRQDRFAVKLHLKYIKPGWILAYRHPMKIHQRLKLFIIATLLYPEWLQKIDFAYNTLLSYTNPVARFNKKFRPSLSSHQTG